MVRRALLLWTGLCLAITAIACPAAAQEQAPAPAKQIALTFDDVPRGAGAFLNPDQRTVMLIAALHRAGVAQAAFFLNPGHIEGSQGGAERIEAYVAAGHVIANHSWSHPDLTATDTADYLDNIDRAEAWLKGREGRRPWFRYPFLDEGRRDAQKRDAVRAGLAARGLHDGYVTAESSDWKIEGLTIDAARAGKTIDMDALRTLYVESHVAAAEFADTLARKATGRSPIHVMLLHETDIAALYIDDLVAALRAEGWTIATADAAYADPIAVEATRYDTPSAQGTLTEMLAWQKGLPAPRWYERNNEPVMERLFRERVLHEEVE